MEITIQQWAIIIPITITGLGVVLTLISMTRQQKRHDQIMASEQTRHNQIMEQHWLVMEQNEFHKNIDIRLSKNG